MNPLLHPNTEGSIRVFHITKTPIDKILREGLKTVAQLMNEGEMERRNPSSYGLLRDQYTHIYFRPVENADNYITAIRGCTWIAIDVHPDSIVYDSELRFERNLSYYASQITLRDYVAPGSATGITRGGEILITQPVLSPEMFSDNSRDYWLRKENEAKKVQVPDPQVSSGAGIVNNSYTSAPFIPRSSELLSNVAVRQKQQSQNKHCCTFL